MKRNGSCPGWHAALMSALLGSLLTVPIEAQTLASSVFARLEGRWIGHGELFGRSAFFEMAWAREHDGVATLRFANGFVGDDGQRTPVLDAVALYRVSPASPQAIWLDSRGAQVTIRWEASDSMLTAHWRTDSEKGRTEYLIVSDAEVRVTDHVHAESGWRQFGHATYSRRGAAGTFDPALAHVAWLAGCWRRGSGEGVTDEQWMAPEGNTMLGMSRSMRGNQLRQFEHLRIQVIDGRATYIAHPSGQAEAAFPMIMSSDTVVVFENTEHDFPQRIGYRPVGSDSLVAWIEGESNGETRRIPFPFRRVSCGVAR